jgi:hypothetical protein
MAELPFFKEGQFLRARDLNNLVEYVRSLQLEIAGLRKELGELPRGAPLPELDFSPKVIYFSGDHQFLQYPWSVTCKSELNDFGSREFREQDVIPNDQCELKVIDPSGVPCVEIRDDSLVPLRIGRSMLRVVVPFPTRDSVFTVEVRYP